MQLKEVLVQQAGMPKPLAAEVRPADDGIQLVFSLSRQQVDEYSGSIRTVTFEHHEIHDGDHFFIQDVVDLSLNDVLDMQFTTPDTDKYINFTFELECEAETEWYIYEGATILLAGTAVTPRNNNRNSSKTSGATVATITNGSVGDANLDTAVAGATQLAHGMIGALRSGGDTKRENEIILKRNTVYCMRAIANVAGWIAFVTEWYEHRSEVA